MNTRQHAQRHVQKFRRANIAAGLCLFFALLPSIVLAAPVTAPATTTEATTGTGSTVIEFPKMNLNVPIPGLELASNIKVVDGYIDVPFLAQYIAAIYRYIIGISVVVASIMFVYGGFLYVLGGTTGNIMQAKEIIKDAIIGLILVFSIQLIINTLSPESFNLQPLRVAYIVPKEQIFFQIVGATSPYTDGKNSGGEAQSTALGEPDPNYTPPEGCPKTKNPASANSYGRMMQACQGKNGTPQDLLDVLKVWKKAGIDESGSVYAWGGMGGGKKLVVSAGGTDAHSLDMYISAVYDTTFFTPDVRSACGLDGVSIPGGFAAGTFIGAKTAQLVKDKLNGACGAAVGPAFNKYMDAVRCNNVFGGDCVTTADALLACAHVLGKGVAKSPLASVRNMAYAAITSGDVTDAKLSAAGGIYTASNGIVFAKTKDDMLRAKTTGLLKFGATIGVRCAGHIITYTGGAPGDFPYDIFQTGNGGGAPAGPKAALTFINNGKPSDLHNYAMSLVSTLADYVKNAATNCPNKEPRSAAEWYFYNQF